MQDRVVEIDASALRILLAAARVQLLLNQAPEPPGAEATATLRQAVQAAEQVLGLAEWRL